MTADESDRLTAERMADPQPGDRFHEFFTYWVEIIDRDGEWLIIRDTTDGGPDDDLGPPRVVTIDEFRRQHAYESIPGYWVRYAGHRRHPGDVPADPDERWRWWERLRAEKVAQLTSLSMEGACL